MNRIVKDFNVIDISIVSEPICLAAIFMQAEKRTHPGRIYSIKNNSICSYNIYVDKYDKAMKLLEM